MAPIRNSLKKMPTPANEKRRGVPLWIPVTLAFLLLIAAWTALIIIAKNNPPEFIPVETAEAK